MEGKPDFKPVATCANCVHIVETVSKSVNKNYGFAVHKVVARHCSLYNNFFVKQPKINVCDYWRGGSR